MAIKRIFLFITILLLLCGTAFSGNTKEDSRLAQLARDIMPTVEQLRGLAYDHEVPVGVYTQEQIREMMLADLESQEEELRNTQAALVKMGLCSPDVDIYESMVSMYETGIAGFYNPQNEELNLVEMELSPMLIIQDLIMRATLGHSQEEMVMAHELTHALDDQHFDLLNTVDAGQSDSDTYQAWKCLVEGTAGSVQYDFLYNNQGILSYENPMVLGMTQQTMGSNMLSGGESAIPNFLVKQLTLHYGMGMTFVLELRRENDGSWDQVNAAFSDLPASTEQILHPEKYMAEERDMPVVFELPNIPEMLPGDWNVLMGDVMGEYGFLCMLEEVFAGRRSAQQIATQASEGWGGDRYAVYQDDKNPEIASLVWATSWDTEEDAIEFFRVYKVVLRQKYEEVPESESTTSYEFNDTKETTCMLVREGTEVFILETIPNSVVEEVKDTLMGLEHQEWQTPAEGNIPRENEETEDD